jgi:hypothetical protein
MIAVVEYTFFFEEWWRLQYKGRYREIDTKYTKLLKPYDVLSTFTL